MNTLLYPLIYFNISSDIQLNSSVICSNLKKKEKENKLSV